MGKVGWNQPRNLVYSTVDVGTESFEKDVTCVMGCPVAVPQPEDDSEYHLRSMVRAFGGRSIETLARLGYLPP